MAFREFRYKVELKYIHESKEEDITTEGIKFICIDSDYLGKKAFPVVYLGLNLDKKIYNKMIRNIQKDTVVFSLSKYNVSDDGSSNSVESKVIKDEFIYFFNETNSTDSDDTTDKEAIEMVSIKIGLISLDILNMCKNVKNDVLVGNMSSILYDYLDNKAEKVIIEPLDNNKEFEELIIPPVPTLNKLLEYLNNTCSFYNTQYRFFIDLNKTVYLLSSKGKAIETKDSKYSSIIVRVSADSSNVDKYKEAGVEIDTSNKCYNLYLDESNTSTTINVYKDKEVNKIITISTNGVINKSTLDNSDNAKGTRTSIYRTFNENEYEIKNIKNLIESNKVMMNITKEGVDCSMITPEKSISVENHELYKKFNGKYLLAGKQEIYMMNDSDSFTCNTTLKLLRIKS